MQGREEVFSSRSDFNDRLESALAAFQENIKENQRWQTDISRVIREQYRSDLSYNVTQFSPPNITKFGLEAQADRFARLLLGSLKYKEMQERHERISDRYRKTFEWIFHEDNLGTSWTNFAKWLKGPAPLYWIT